MIRSSTDIFEQVRQSSALDQALRDGGIGFGSRLGSLDHAHLASSRLTLSASSLEKSQRDVLRAGLTGPAFKHLAGDVTGLGESASRLSKMMDELLGLGRTTASLKQRIGDPAIGSLSGLDRLSRLAHQLGSQSGIDLKRMLGVYEVAGVDLLLERSRSVRDIVAQIGQTSGLTLPEPLSATASNVALKLSAFSGATDLMGPSTRLANDAFRSLLGGWQSTTDLPSRFYRDNEYRRAAYRDADVDPWLIETGNQEILEVLVESGTVKGRSTRSGTSAVVSVGSVEVTVHASRAASRARDVVEALELGLRAFVAAKLEAAVAAEGKDPKRWFVQRVPAEVVTRAKETRREALKAMEKNAPLINFTQIGDLLHIILRGDNWPVFAPALLDKEAFKIDLQRVNTFRRPASHSRHVDGPQLVELVLVVRRLVAMMETDGETMTGWDDDF